MRKVSGQAVELWRASLDPLANMQGEFSRWLEQAWRQGLSARVPGAPLFGESLFAALAGAPIADLYETQAGLELVVELPGLSAQQVQLSLTGDILTVSGERTETGERNEGAYRVRERRSGGFRRAFALPADVDAKGIQAHFDKGVLTVSIPRSGEGRAESRTIPIES
jgi:HSP20 family protein